MKILVDADACPVKDIIKNVAKEYNIPVVFFIDTSHQLNYADAEVITVDKGKDAVDIALMNHVAPKDIVISQDYGVAAMALGKGAYCLNHNGLIFHKDNIDQLLFDRYMSARARRTGHRGGKHKKRTFDDNQYFEQTFTKFIENYLSTP